MLLTKSAYIVEKINSLSLHLMDNSFKRELCDYLSTFISEKRKLRLLQVLDKRSGHLRIVLENVYQSHNASAVLRSCDCFGIQYVHYIENGNKIKISEDVALGSSNWLSITRHNQLENNTVEAINSLKKMGYRIVATSPHKDDFTLDTLPVDKKIALVFGTELEGISETVMQHADAFVKIPMFGFTESFNISVSAALCMYELNKRIRQTVPDYLLNEQEKLDVYYEWLSSSIDKSEVLVNDYLKKKQI